MPEILAPAIALVVAVFIGLWLYGRYAAAGDATVAIFGLFRNLMTFIIGVFALMSGMWPLIILGGFLIILAVFLGSTHANNLDESTSLRKRLAG